MGFVSVNYSFGKLSEQRLLALFSTGREGQACFSFSSETGGMKYLSLFITEVT